MIAPGDEAMSSDLSSVPSSLSPSPSPKIKKDTKLSEKPRKKCMVMNSPFYPFFPPFLSSSYTHLPHYPHFCDTPNAITEKHACPRPNEYSITIANLSKVSIWRKHSSFAHAPQPSDDADGDEKDEEDKDDEEDEEDDVVKVYEEDSGVDDDFVCSDASSSSSDPDLEKPVYEHPSVIANHNASPPRPADSLKRRRDPSNFKSPPEPAGSPKRHAEEHKRLLDQALS